MMRPSRLLIARATAALLCLGCAHRAARGGGADTERAVPCDTTAPGPSLDPALRVPDRPAASGRVVTPDEQWARIARETPGGFAGMYLERPTEPVRRNVPPPQQRVVIRLVHPEMRDSALRALEPHLRAMFGGRAFDFSDALIVPARWDFAQLYDWYNYLNASGVWGRDIDFSDISEGENHITYGVVSAEGEARMLARLAELNVPCGLVQVRMTGPVVGANGIPTSPPPIRGPVVAVDSAYRPLPDTPPARRLLIQAESRGPGSGRYWLSVTDETRILHPDGRRAAPDELRLGAVVRVWPHGDLLLSDPAQGAAFIIVVE